jgi:hypothetical protein
MEMTSTVAGASVQGGGDRPPLLVYDHGMFPNNRQTAFSVADQRRLFTHAVPELTENNFHVTTFTAGYSSISGSLKIASCGFQIMNRM